MSLGWKFDALTVIPPLLLSKLIGASAKAEENASSRFWENVLENIALLLTRVVIGQLVNISGIFCVMDSW